MAANRVKTYKRLSIGLTKELDQSIATLRARKEYSYYSTLELIRILMIEGARAMEVYPLNDGEKS